MLGAVLLALAAAHAAGGLGGLLPQSGTHDVVRHAPELSVGGAAVVGGEGAGDVHPVRAGHAVAAAGAAHLHFGVDGGHHLGQHGAVFLGELSGAGLVGDAHVLRHHLHGVHAAEDAGDLALIPQPAKAPLGGAAAAGMGCKQLFGLRRQVVHQPSATERLHDDNHQPLGCGVLQSGAAGLAVLVQIVVLDLAEVPVPGVHQTAEGVGVAVVGKTHLRYSAGGLLCRQPLLDAQGLQAVPGLVIGEHVHEVVVHVVGAQAAQLLIEVLVQALPGLDEVVGQLGGDVHLVPQAVALQNGAQGGLTAGVDIGGIEVVDPGLDGGKQLLLRLVQIHAPRLLGKAHAPVAQHGHGIAVFVMAILHGDASLGMMNKISY